MVASGFWWHLLKSSAVGGLIGLAISDQYVSVVPIRGSSMHPTFVECATSFPISLSGDLALAEKSCLRRYEFSQGDVILLRSPSDYKRHVIKRIIGLPSDWIQVPDKSEIVKVPDGHCWVEGDNSYASLDSRSYGPITVFPGTTPVRTKIHPETKVLDSYGLDKRKDNSCNLAAS